MTKLLDKIDLRKKVSFDDRFHTSKFELKKEHIIELNIKDKPANLNKLNNNFDNI